MAAQAPLQKLDPKTLAAGRVILSVTDHAIVVAALPDSGTPGSWPPAVVPIGNNYVAVIFGPVVWNHDDPAIKPTRIDAELPVTAAASHRFNGSLPDQPSDIEAIGIAVLELLRPLVDEIHYQLDLPADQPFFELILTDYAPDYDPEIWSLQYRVRQRLLQTDFWSTEIQRPAYHQLYPPEKGHPRVAIEVQNPKNAEPGFLDRLARHDPVLEPIRTSSDEMAIAAAALGTFGTSKTPTISVVNFLRAALPAMPLPARADTQVSAAGSGLVMAALGEREGFQWLIRPAEPVPAPTINTNQDPSAPSLRRYTPDR